MLYTIFFKSSVTLKLFQNKKILKKSQAQRIEEILTDLLSTLTGLLPVSLLT